MTVKRKMARVVALRNMSHHTYRLGGYQVPCPDTYRLLHLSGPVEGAAEHRSGVGVVEYVIPRDLAESFESQGAAKIISKRQKALELVTEDDLAPQAAEPCEPCEPCAATCEVCGLQPRRPQVVTGQDVRRLVAAENSTRVHEYFAKNPPRAYVCSREDAQKLVGGPVEEADEEAA